MLVLFSPAAAAPTFVADDPALAALAARAWEHATACTGEEALADELVTLTIGGVGGGFEGRAFVRGPRRTVWRDAVGNVVRTEETDPGGLHEIRFAKDSPKPSTVAHEVAHAWVHGGPPGLTEGATDLLAACIATRDPKRFPPEPPESTDLADLLDLRAWANEDDANGAQRNAGYVASERMFAALAGAVPRERLWRSGWTWEEFDAVLDEAGLVGTLLRGALTGGVDAQRVLLGDRDEDGAITLAEHVAGTDPTRWDTDGDGWWDGAPDDLRDTAVPLPDGKPVCSGWAAGPFGASVRVRGGIVGVGGKVRGAGARAPRLVIDGVRPKDQSTPMSLERGASILLEPVFPKGGWGAVEGTGLVKDRRCATVGPWTVFAARGIEELLPPFAAALGRAEARVAANLGAPDARGFLWLGEGWKRHVVAPEVVPHGWLARGAAGEWDYVAAFVVARARIPGDAALADAFARSLLPRPPTEGLTFEDVDVAGWTAVAKKCPGGWAAAIAGACGAPPAPAETAGAGEEAVEGPP